MKHLYPIKQTFETHNDPIHVNGLGWTSTIFYCNRSVLIIIIIIIIHAYDMISWNYSLFFVYFLDLLFVKLFSIKGIGFTHLECLWWNFMAGCPTPQQSLAFDFSTMFDLWPHKHGPSSRHAHRMVHQSILDNWYSSQLQTPRSAKVDRLHRLMIRTFPGKTIQLDYDIVATIHLS